MPDGDRTYCIRISGQGRFLINMKEKDISIVNVRAPEEKSTISWEEFRQLVMEDEKGRTFAEKKPEKKLEKKKVETSKTPKKQENVKKTDESVRKTEESAQKPVESVQIADESAEKAEVAPVQPPEEKRTSEENPAYERFLAVSVGFRQKAREGIKALMEFLPFLEKNADPFSRETVKDFAEYAADLHDTAARIYECFDYHVKEERYE